MTKSYNISKYIVLEAFKRVKANQGAAGVDEVSIKEFEKDLNNNLYRIWNRMSSGSYFPSSVRKAEIPKKDGKLRTLGIPTVSDRVAQMIVKMYLEPSIDPHFHKDSYGYRPGKSGIDAVGVARRRCWDYDWVIDIDIKGFFDNIDHELMMKAVEKHKKEPWILLYVQRWLKAPMQSDDGTITHRDKGTPQGGVISPLLANLFLHYAFDMWMQRNYSQTPFERYADDIVIHCRSENEAIILKDAIKVRLQECKLELHPEKTKIVYCKDANRPGSYHNEKFDFLGYTFRPRSSKNKKGKLFVNFTPAISDKAKQKLKDEIKDVQKEVKPTANIKDFIKILNPKISGWINYYGKYNPAELWSIMRNIDTMFLKWLNKKYNKLKKSWHKANVWLNQFKKREPNMFASWRWMRRNDLDRRAV